MGRRFDLGMGERVVVVSVPAPSSGKSFQNMVEAYADSQSVSAQD